MLESKDDNHLYERTLACFSRYNTILDGKFAIGKNFAFGENDLSFVIERHTPYGRRFNSNSASEIKKGGLKDNKTNLTLNYNLKPEKISKYQNKETLKENSPIKIFQIVLGTNAIALGTNAIPLTKNLTKKVLEDSN